jgi:PAS domain S-box-containing protein
MEKIIGKVCRFLQRFSLTVKITILTIMVGVVVWLSSDYIIGLSVKRVFEDHLVDMMNEEALDARNSFDGFIKSHSQAVRLITAQKRFLDYIDGSEWTNGNAFGVKHEMSLPRWLPRPSVLRQFVHIRYALLLDSKGRVREVYQGAPGPPPETLLHPSGLLRKLSHNQSLMTTLEGMPFLVASESVLTHTGETRATLMIASPLDEQFLVSSQRPSLRKRLVALVSPDKNRVMVSNRPDLLPTGTLLDELEEDYLVTGKGFFDYGASDLALGFATFVSKKEVESLSRPIVSSGRFEHTIMTVMFILSFSLIILWVTKRIARLTDRVEEFSREALGGKPQAPEGGDQLNILEDRFQRLTEEVIRSREELERRVEERTGELRRERDRAQRYLDVAGVMFVVVGADRRVRVINRKGCEILGYEEHEIKGRDWFGHFIPERMRNRVSAVFDRLMSGQAAPVEYFENPVLTKDGRERLVAWHNIILRDAQGGAIGTLSSGEDITDRKQAEEERKKLVITLNTLVEHLPEGVFLLDGEYRIILANPVAEEYLKAISGAGVGDSLKRIAGRPIRDLLVSPPNLLWHDIEVEGRTFEAAGRAVGAEKEGGGVVFVLRDVTEDRQLGGRIQLQERLAAVGQLAAGIAHDFNNILTIINGYAEVLLTDMDMQLSGEVRQGIDAILQSGKKAADLIHQILDFSRRTVEEMEPVSLVPFLKEFLRFIERTIPENIRISLGYEPSEYVVTADVTKLQQVLANLVVNARDAMPEGGELKLSLSRLRVAPHEKPPLPDMPEGEWVALSVSDTGGGVAYDVLPHIYEPFFSTKGVGKGTGLGLSQVYGLVKQHKGYIDVKTGERGSVFTVYLPAQEGLKEEPGAAVEAEAPRGEGQTVLVAEDDEAVRDLVSKVLRGLGYRVLTATDGKEALELFDRHIGEVSLVITDLVMPEIDGIQLSRLLRQKAPSVKVMALSGYALGVEREELLEAGVVELLQKPFKVQTLARMVFGLLDKTQADAEES